MTARRHPCAYCHRRFWTFGGLMRHLLKAQHQPVIDLFDAWGPFHEKRAGEHS